MSIAGAQARREQQRVDESFLLHRGPSSDGHTGLSLPCEMARVAACGAAACTILQLLARAEFVRH